MNPFLLSRLLVPRLMGQNAESDKTGAEREVSSITERLATLFSTLNEFPSIRYAHA